MPKRVINFNNDGKASVKETAFKCEKEQIALGDKAAETAWKEPASKADKSTNNKVSKNAK